MSVPRPETFEGHLVLGLGTGAAVWKHGSRIVGFGCHERAEVCRETVFVHVPSVAGLDHGRPDEFSV